MSSLYLTGKEYSQACENVDEARLQLEDLIRHLKYFGNWDNDSRIDTPHQDKIKRTILGTTSHIQGQLKWLYDYMYAVNDRYEEPEMYAYPTRT